MTIPKQRPWHILSQGSLYCQPKQCTIVGEIPQHHHIFALFDPPKMGNLMIPVSFQEEKMWNQLNSPLAFVFKEQFILLLSVLQAKLYLWSEKNR